MGETPSPAFSLVNPVQSHLKGGRDAFLCKLGPAGGFEYPTYLGGADADGATAVAVDRFQNVCVTGMTRSDDSPVTPGAFQTVWPPRNPFGITTIAFVSKLSSDGQSLLYSTLLGGTKVSCSGGSRCIPATARSPGTSLGGLEVHIGGFPKPRLTVSVEPWGFAPLEVLYAGQAPGLVADVMQTNFRLPETRLGSDQPVIVLIVGEFQSEPFSINVAR